MVRYVVKNGGKFIAENGGYTNDLSKAWLGTTRQSARAMRMPKEKVYKVTVKVQSDSFEKVS